MKGDFCRMCGSKNLRRQKKDIFIKSQNKILKAVSIWICENCGEEFLDDASRERVYKGTRKAKSRKSLACIIHKPLWRARMVNTITRRVGESLLRALRALPFFESARCTARPCLGAQSFAQEFFDSCAHHCPDPDVKNIFGKHRLNIRLLRLRQHLEELKASPQRALERVS